MYRLNVRVLAFCLAVLGMAVPVFAQSAPKAELSAGYQFLNFVVDGENESMAKGWYFDVAGKSDADVRTRLPDRRELQELRRVGLPRRDHVNSVR
jgi:hypothetical protein